MKIICKRFQKVYMGFLAKSRYFNTHGRAVAKSVRHEAV
jgi:hypothetical protein